MPSEDDQHVARLLSQTTPPPSIREKIPHPVEEPGIFDPPTCGGHRGLVVDVFNCGPTGRRFGFCLVPEHFDFSPVVHDWKIKGLGMSSRVCATGHIENHKLYDWMF